MSVLYHYIELATLSAASMGAPPLLHAVVRLRLPLPGRGALLQPGHRHLRGASGPASAQPAAGRRGPGAPCPAGRALRGRASPPPAARARAPGGAQATERAPKSFGFTVVQAWPARARPRSRVRSASSTCARHTSRLLGGRERARNQAQGGGAPYATLPYGSRL